MTGVAGRFQQAERAGELWWGGVAWSKTGAMGKLRQVGACGERADTTEKPRGASIGGVTRSSARAPETRVNPPEQRRPRGARGGPDGARVAGAAGRVGASGAEPEQKQRQRLGRGCGQGRGRAGETDSVISSRVSFPGRWEQGGTPRAWGGGEGGPQPPPGPMGTAGLAGWDPLQEEVEKEATLLGWQGGSAGGVVVGGWVGGWEGRQSRGWERGQVSGSAVLCSPFSFVSPHAPRLWSPQMRTLRQNRGKNQMHIFIQLKT